MSMEWLKTAAAGVAGASGVVIAYAGYQQQSGSSVAAYAERIRANEMSIQSSTGKLEDAATELKTLTQRLESVASVTQNAVVRAELDEIAERLKALESRPSTGGGSVSAEAVAEILARDYADVLRGERGPAGPQGQAGPAGPRGPVGETVAGGGGGDPTRPIQITADFQSDFEPQYWGGLKTELLGCKNSGGKIQCSFVLTPDEDLTFSNHADYNRIALADGSFSTASKITLAGKSGDGWIKVPLVSGIPSRYDVVFNASDSADGALLIELGNDNKISWRNVPYS